MMGAFDPSIRSRGEAIDSYSKGVDNGEARGAEAPPDFFTIKLCTIKGLSSHG